MGLEVRRLSDVLIGALDFVWWSSWFSGSPIGALFATSPAELGLHVASALSEEPSGLDVESDPGLLEPRGDASSRWVCTV
jgi:hypothetical protein